MEKKIAFKKNKKKGLLCFITFGPINLMENNAFSKRARKKIIME